MHNEKEGFLVKGWAEDLNHVLLNARINLAPLRFGAGIKGKLIDAMLNGLPSMTTPIGAEGMHGELPWPGVICDGDDKFIEATISLYQNKSDWQRARQNGVGIINQLYDATALKNKFFTTLSAIFKDLEKHRANNFIGQMVQHQSLASTKFMGKWIEEKSRKKSGN